MSDEREDDSQRFHVEVQQAQEHMEWLADRAAQAEYQSWLDRLNERDDKGTFSPF